MPNWNIKEINLRLEFAVQASAQVNTRLDPYEIALPITANKFEVTAQVQNVMLDKAVLGLQIMETSGNRYYILYRRDDLITLAPGIERVQAALKVNFALTDPATNESVESTTYYPIHIDNDNSVSAMPNKPWTFLLLQEDGTSPEYQLIRMSQGGREQALHARVAMIPICLMNVCGNASLMGVTELIKDQTDPISKPAIALYN